MNRRTGYLAHPVAGDVAGNTARALRWYGWIAEQHPEVAWSVPWLASVMVFQDEPAARVRGMEDNLAWIDRCDVIGLTGGRLSPGMGVELSRAQHRGHLILDYLYLGDEPPWVPGARPPDEPPPYSWWRCLSCGEWTCEEGPQDPRACLRCRR